jgi:hypothetical protein
VATKKLSRTQVQRYERDGFVAPVRAFSPSEAASYRRQLEAIEQALGGPLPANLQTQPHLLFKWLDDFIRHPGILDAVEDLVGPNVLCYISKLFMKEPHDPAFLAWHQDATYWGLEPPDIVTAWVAFTPSNRSNGCVRVIPGSHKQLVEHVDTYDPNSMASRGQEIAVEVDEAQAVDLVLEPGEMSFHHDLIFHGSDPNDSDGRRIGFGIRYMSTAVRTTAGRNRATLVRGVDEYGHWDLNPRPRWDFDPEAVEARADALTRRPTPPVAAT